MGFIKSIKDEFRDLYRFRWVTYSFVTSNLKIRYKRSLLGVFWSMLGPALNYLVMGIVFSILMKSAVPNYFTFMFSGAVFFYFMNATIIGGLSVLIGNEHYIKKIYLPKSIFVLNSLLLEAINFGFGLTTLLIYWIGFSDVKIGMHWLALLFVALVGFLFLFGIVSIISILTVYFRDMVHILPVIMQAVFFATPVLYTVDSVPEQYRYLVHLNPLYYFVEAFRAPIYYGLWPSQHVTIVILTLACFSLFLGIFLLKYFDNKIVFKL